MSNTRYRQFKLINSVEAEYDLCHLDHALYSPDGLGFSKSHDSVQVGSAFAMVEERLNQQTITGEMIFKGYEKYSEFKDFISDSDLTLAYQPIYNSTWYYRSCRVKELKKGEISPTTHRLHCAIDFLCFSQWYESAFAERTVEEVSEDSLFSLVFPFQFADVSINEVRIINSQTAPAPCKIIISGPVSNPHWSLISGGKTIASGGVQITLVAGEQLIIDANIESMGITKLSGNTETNAYQYSDFSTERFIYAPSGESKLRFTHSSSAALDVIVEVRKLSDTV